MRLYCTRDCGVNNSAPNACMRRATRCSAQPRRGVRNPGEDETHPGVDENKIFHPKEVVRGLDFDVPERGGRRTINVGINKWLRGRNAWSDGKLRLPWTRSTLPHTYARTRRNLAGIATQILASLMRDHRVGTTQGTDFNNHAFLVPAVARRSRTAIMQSSACNLVTSPGEASKFLKKIRPGCKRSFRLGTNVQRRSEVKPT